MRKTANWLIYNELRKSPRGIGQHGLIGDPRAVVGGLGEEPEDHQEADREQE